MQEAEAEMEGEEEEGNEVVEDWEGKEKKEEERTVLMVGEDMKGEEKVVWEAEVERVVVMRPVGDDR